VTSRCSVPRATMMVRGGGVVSAAMDRECGSFRGQRGRSE
jgi:hypothetical protein